MSSTKTATKSTKSKSSKSKKSKASKSDSKVEDKVPAIASTDATETGSDEKTKRNRREVSKDTVDNAFVELQAKLEAEIAKHREEKKGGVKFLRSLNKALKTLHSDTKRVMRLKKRNNRKKTVVSGFLKPIKISAEMAQFCGWDVNQTYSRVDVTKFICKYIKDNKLTSTDDKREILVDDRLKALFRGYEPGKVHKSKSGKDIVNKSGKAIACNFFLLQRFLKHHFINTEVPKSSVPTEEKAKSKPKSNKAKGGSKKPKSAGVEEEPELGDDDDE